MELLYVRLHLYNQKFLKLQLVINIDLVKNTPKKPKEKWATLYNIESVEQGKGHARNLLIQAKKHFEKIGYDFGGTIALNDRMRNLYKSLGIKEYTEG